MARTTLVRAEHSSGRANSMPRYSAKETIASLLPSTSAILGYAMEGKPYSPMRICPLESQVSALSICLRSSTTRLFDLSSSLTVFLNSVYCFIRSANQWLGPVGSHTRLTSFDRNNSEEPLLSVDRCAGPYQSVNIGRIRSKQNAIVPSRFQ